MSTDERSTHVKVIESRLHSVMPPEPTDSELVTVRTKMTVTRPNRRRVVGRVASIALAVVLLLLAAALYGRGPSESAFAYEAAANALLAQDGVLHVVVVQIPLESDPTPIEVIVTPPEGTVSSYAEEFWLDSSGERVRQEHSHPVNPEEWSRSTLITADGYTTALHETFNAAGAQSSELVRIPGREYDDPTAVPAWIEQLADEVRVGNCGVSEETTGGVSVWRISWDHSGVDRHTGADYELHTETVVRQSDYRPLTIDYTFATDANVWDPGLSARFEVREWEMIEYEDVPPELFDPSQLQVDDNADDPAETGSNQIQFLADDPQLFEFSEFPVWYLGDDGSFGRVVGAEHNTVGESDRQFAPAILYQGAFTFVYDLEVIVGAGATITPMDGYTVTTYAETNPAAADAWWAETTGWGNCTAGSFDGVDYRMCADSDRAMILVIMEGYPVVITARDETSVLTALGALQSL